MKHGIHNVGWIAITIWMRQMFWLTTVCNICFHIFWFIYYLFSWVGSGKALFFLQADKRENRKCCNMENAKKGHTPLMVHTCKYEFIIDNRISHLYTHPCMILRSMYRWYVCGKTRSGLIWYVTCYLYVTFTTSWVVPFPEGHITFRDMWCMW